MKQLILCLLLLTPALSFTEGTSDEERTTMMPASTESEPSWKTILCDKLIPEGIRGGMTAFLMAVLCWQAYWMGSLYAGNDAYDTGRSDGSDAGDCSCYWMFDDKNACLLAEMKNCTNSFWWRN